MDSRGSAPPTLSLWPVTGIGEVRPGDDLGGLIADHITDLADGDIVIVASKIVSKAEGQLVPGTSRAQAIAAETARVVAERGETQIVQTRHGFVMAAAGVDASNVEPGQLVLLPKDPDASARRLRTSLATRFGVRVGVVITDTFGRPWRLGQTDLAVGAAGVAPLDDFGGRRDGYGNELAVTAPARVDELAAAADLVKPKLAGTPVAIARGLGDLVTTADGPGVRAVIRAAADDLFSLGTREAMRATLQHTPDDRISDSPPATEAIDRLLALVWSVAPPAGVSLTGVEPESARKELLAAVSAPSVATALVVATPPDASVQTLLDAGGLRERIMRACAVERLAARWIPAENLAEGADGLARSLCAPHQPVGVVAVGARTDAT